MVVRALSPAAAAAAARRHNEGGDNGPYAQP